jgi:hypothetical protein
MIIEPAAKQIIRQPLSTATMPARPLRFLFPCAQGASPLHPFGNLRLAPSSGSLTLSSEALAGCSQRATPWIKVNNRKHADFARRSAVSGAPIYSARAALWWGGQGSPYSGVVLWDLKASHAPVPTLFQN